MTAATSTSWISKKADRCGGAACVRDVRITVWGLVEWRRLGLADSEIMRAVNGLTQGDLDVAMRYADANLDEINTAIRLNDEA